MSVSFSCHCEERKKPVKERRWVIMQRCCNHSAFSGYHRTPSDYSTVMCLSCLSVGRTKARYIDELRNITMDELRG